MEEKKKYFQNLKIVRGKYLVSDEEYRIQEIPYAEDVVLMTPKYSVGNEKLLCIKYNGGHRLLFGFVTRGEDPVYINADGTLSDEPKGALLRNVVKKQLSDSKFNPKDFPGVRVQGLTKKKQSLSTKSWVNQVFRPVLEELGLGSMVSI